MRRVRSSLFVLLVVGAVLLGCSLQRTSPPVRIVQPLRPPLPAVRPPDFAITTDFGWSLDNTRWSIQDDHCVYETTQTIPGKDGNLARTVLLYFLDCTMTNEELDTLYQQVRDSQFHQIGTEIEQGGCRGPLRPEPVIEVTAAGTHHAPLASMAWCVRFNGADAYKHLNGQLYELLRMKESASPIDLVVIFRPQRSSGEVRDLAVRERGNLCQYIERGIEEAWQSGSLIRFCPGIADTERRRIIAQLESFAEVSQLRHNVACSEGRNALVCRSPSTSRGR